MLRERETFSDATCLCGSPTYRMKGSLLGPNDAELPPELPEQAAFHPVSRQPAQTSGVRKHLSFSPGSDYTVIDYSVNLDETKGGIHLRVRENQ